MGPRGRGAGVALLLNGGHYPPCADGLPHTPGICGARAPSQPSPPPFAQLPPLPAAAHAQPLPSPATFLWETAVCWVARDVLFYFAHRLFHTKWLYARVHKQHHRFTAPFALAAQYAHPAEHLIANVLPVVLPPVALRVHVTAAWALLALALVETSVTHSGFDLMWAAHHDRHHEAFTVNFGAQWLDLLFKTYQPGRVSATKAARQGGQIPSPRKPSVGAKAQ